MQVSETQKSGLQISYFWFLAKKQRLCFVEEAFLEFGYKKNLIFAWSSTHCSKIQTRLPRVHFHTILTCNYGYIVKF